MATSPLGLQIPTPVSASSKMQAFDKELRTKSVLEDVYGYSVGLYSTEKKSMDKAAIYMKIDQKAARDAASITVTMKLPLSGTPVYGNGQLIGTEEQAKTLNFKAYRNNLRKAVVTPGYGTAKLDADYLGLWKKHIDGLSQWAKEQEGLEIRQALVEQYAYMLTQGDTSGSCVQNINPNVFTCGLGLAAQFNLVYSTNPATFASNIVTQLKAAGGGSLLAGKTQTLNNVNLSNLVNWLLANQNMIEPLPIPGLPGGTGWILTVSELQAAFMADPTWSTQNLGAFWQASNRTSEAAQKFPGVLGSYKKLLIVEDVRMPTLQPWTSSDGGSGATSLSPGYVLPGNNDQRNRGQAYVRDIAIVHGKGAVWNWTAEPLHFVKQFDDYELEEGTGIATVRGIGIPVFNGDSTSGDTGYGTGTVQNSSAIVLCGLPDYVPSGS